MKELEEAYLTIPAAAALLGVTRAALYGAIKEDRLKSETVFGRSVIRKEEVAAYQQRTASVGEKGGRPKVQRQVGRPRKNPLPAEGIAKRSVGRPKKQDREMMAS